MSEEQHGSSNPSSDMQAPTPKRRRSSWLLVGIFLMMVLLGGAVSWLALEQNALLVFPGASDNSLGAPLWHYHSDTNVTHQVNWLLGGAGLAYDSDYGTRLNLVHLVTGHPFHYPAPLTAETSCLSQQCSGSSGVAPDGRYAIEVDDAGSPPALNLRVWDLLAGNQRVLDYTQALARSPHQGFDMVWSSDATFVAIEGGDGWLLVWHAVAGQKPFLLSGASGNLSHVTWSQNDEYVAASTDTGMLDVWRTQTQRRVMETPVGAAITFLALSPTGTYAAVATNQQVLQIWDILSETRQLTYRDSTDHTYLGPVWGQDGKHLLSLDKNASAQAETLRIWDATNGRTLAAVPIEMDSGWLLSPDGRSVATEDPGKGTVRIWDTQTGRALASHAGSLPFGALPAWSPDSGRVATVRGDNAVQIWNVQTGQTVYTYPGNRESVMEVSWSPGGQKLAILTTLLTYGLFDFQHASAALHGSSITVWPAPR